MRWHKEGICENDGVMGHPSDGETWKVLDKFVADFASDARNVRFRLAIDGFHPFSTNSTPYSCWPIFALLDNVPGLKALGPRMNVMLKPLMEELKQLWIGVEPYDYYKK
jgi:hypothetical protein